MKVTELKNEGLNRSYKVVIPSKIINKAIEDRTNEVAATAKIDGFRPGKVPLSIVKTRYGSQITGEVIEKKVSESMRKILADNKLKPAVQPKVDFDGKPLDGTDVKFTLNLEVMPDIKIQDFSKLKFERMVVEVDKKDIEKGLENIASNQKSFSVLKTKRKSKNNDCVIIDFKGFMDGKTFEGGSAENHRLELGSGQMIPGFEEQLIGFNINDETKVKVTFPKNYQKAEFSEKEAVFEVKIKDIQEPKKTAINDDLAKKMGLPDLKSMKEAVKNQISMNYNRAARDRIKRDLLDVLSKSYNFDVPKTMLDNENKVIWDRFEQDRKAGALDEEDKGKKDSVLKKEYNEIAERRVRLGLFMSAVGEKNKITVTEEELKGAVMQEARRYPGEENKVLEFYQKNPEAANAIRAPLFEEKVVDHIISKCTVKDVKVTVDKLYSDNNLVKKSAKKAAKNNKIKKDKK